jgi:hypothetical protein
MSLLDALRKMQSPVKGDKPGDIILARPQPWHDQRNVLDAYPAEQPQSIDYTDLKALGWKA